MKALWTIEEFSLRIKEYIGVIRVIYVLITKGPEHIYRNCTFSRGSCGLDPQP